MSNKVKRVIARIAHRLFDWRTAYNPITYRWYPELYDNIKNDKFKRRKVKIKGKVSKKR